MKFKAGDRVHVKRLDGEEVEFYATLRHVDGTTANLFDCTNKKYNYVAVYLPNDDEFGENKTDYFVLAEDEEDTKGGNNMPTIKRKVEMNLPQLIEWAWDNKEQSKNKRFISENKGNLAIKQSVIFNHFSYAEIENNYCYGPEDIFTVEIEEIVTEDTKFDIIVLIERDGCSATWANRSINKLKDNDSKEFHAYIDGKFELIWRDGRLVD